MKRHSSAIDLNPAELEALGILWSDSPLKPAEIQSRFARPIENATLRSILRSLVEKGYARRKRIGKAYFYRPARQPQTVRRKLTDRMAAVFAEGSRLGLIAQLIRDEQLSPEQLQELQQLAGETDEP